MERQTVPMTVLNSVVPPVHSLDPRKVSPMVALMVCYLELLKNSRKVLLMARLSDQGSVSWM